MKYFITLLLIVCALNLEAQTINKTYDFNNELEETSAFVEHNNKYYILGLGRTKASTFTNLGVELYIIDKKGVKLYSNSNKQAEYSMGVGFNNSFQIRNDTDLISVNSAYLTSSTSVNYYHGLITCYDTLLNTKWQKNYIGNKSFLRTFQFTPEGDILVLGETKNMGNGFLDILLLKLDKDGNEKWRKSYGGTDDDRAKSLIILEDGNYLIGGNHVTQYGVDGDGWLIKTDTAGNVIWDSYIADIGADGLINIFGDKYYYKYNDTMHKAPWDGFYERHFFGEFNDTGKVVWQDQIEEKEDLVIKCALKLNDGGFLIVNSYVEADYGGNVSWIIKYDEERNIIWERYYFAENSASNGLVDVLEDDEGYLVFSGTVLKTDANSDIWLLKLNADGCLDGGDCGEPIGILDLTIAKEKFGVQVNPNPVSSFAKIMVQNTTNHLREDLTVSIYNIAGKKIFEDQQVLRGQFPFFDINCNEWQKGIYFVKATINGVEYGNTKFLVR